MNQAFLNKCHQLDILGLSFSDNIDIFVNNKYNTVIYIMNNIYFICIYSIVFILIYDSLLFEFRLIMPYNLL